MAVTVDELLIKIELSGQKTSQELSKISNELDKIKKSSDRAAGGVDNFSARFVKFGAAAFVALKGIEGLITTVSRFTDEYMQAQDAVTRLNQALEISGTKNIPLVIDQYKDLGAELENFGVASNETVLKLAKIGVAVGQTTDQTRALIKTAADLSVVREIPLEQAFKALSSTLKGSSGQLAALFPELKNLTDEQLKAGKAIEYVSLQVGGFASRNLETYSGRMAVLRTKVGDTVEILGQFISKILELDTSIGKSTNKIQRFNEFLLSIEDTVVALGQTIISYLVDIWDAAAAKIADWSSLIQQTLGTVLVYFGKLQKLTDDLAGRNTKWGESQIALGESLLKSAKENSQIYVDWITGTEQAEQATNRTVQSINQITTTAKSAKDALAEIRAEMMTPEQQQAIEALQNKVIEFQKAQEIAGKTGIDLFNAQAKASSEEIDAIAKKISGTGKLGSEYQKLVDQAKGFVEVQKLAQVTQFNEEQIQKVNDQYKVLGDEIAKQTMTQREFIDYQLEKELELLEIKRQSAAFATGEAQDLLDATEKRFKAEAAKKKESAPMTGATFESFTKAGQSVAKSLNEVFTAGSLEFVGAAASAVGLIVQAANAVLDLIPDMLNSLANIFNKIADFPNILLNAFSNIFGAITRFVSDFLPNLLNFIPEFLKNLDKFVIGLVDAFVQLFKQLPAIIFGIIKDLPALIENIVSGMVSAVPEIIIAVVDYLIEFGPQIFIKILKAIAIDIPIAILKGIMKGIAKIGEAIKAALTGKSLKLPKVEVDKKQIENLQKRLTDQSSRIFNVSDFLEKAQDPMQAINDGIVEAAEKARDILKEAWMWVMENIIQPIFDGLKAAWMWIYNNIIMPIYNIVRNAWLWVYDNVLAPIYNIVRNAWLWVYDNVIAPIAGVISSAWQWVVDNVITPMTTLGEKIAAPFRDAIKAAGDFFGKIGEAFKSLFKLDFSGVKQAVSEAFNSAGEALSRVFRALINPIIDIFNGLIDGINGLKIREITYGGEILGKKFGGTLIPEIDLIPGEINKLPRFAQGGFVENLGASFSGMGTDTVPAMLTPGEFVMNRRAVEANGLGLLSAMNRGQTPETGDTYVQIEINIDAKTTMDEGYIRGTLIPKMSEELRRASLDGRFVISSRGIR